jgi:hypothetical protein
MALNISDVTDLKKKLRASTLDTTSKRILEDIIDLVEDLAVKAEDGDTAGVDATITLGTDTGDVTFKDGILTDDSTS